MIRPIGLQDFSVLQKYYPSLTTEEIGSRLHPRNRFLMGIEMEKSLYCCLSYEILYITDRYALNILVLNSDVIRDCLICMINQKGLYF